MENVLLFQMLGVVVALFFCFLTYMNTRVWRATHVTFAFLTFGAAVAFIIFASLSLKTRRVWMDMVTKLEKQVDDVRKESDRFANGNLSEVQQADPSIRSLHEAIGREVIDRGRVWRNCIPAPGGNEILVTTGVPNADGSPVKPNHIQARQEGIGSTVLHVFQDVVNPNTGIKQPAVYLGQFEVTAATDTTATVIPTIPLDPAQRQKVQEQGVTWTMYETMPVDNHDPFRGLTVEQLKAMMPIEGTRLTPEEYEAMIQSYHRTSESAATTDQDPPAAVWVEVVFKKPYKVDVNSDGPGVLIVEGNAFDSQGKAVLPRLKREGQAEMDIGETAIFFDDEELRKMIADGIVEKKSTVYRRPLNDYSYMFHQHFARMVEMQTRMKEINRDMEAVLASQKHTEAQIALRSAEKAKVADDLKKTKYETAEVQKYRGSLEQQVAAVRIRCNELYRTNKALAKELAEVSAKLTEEIDQRTRNATAMAAP